MQTNHASHRFDDAAGFMPAAPPDEILSEIRALGPAWVYHNAECYGLTAEQMATFLKQNIAILPADHSQAARNLLLRLQTNGTVRRLRPDSNDRPLPPDHVASAGIVAAMDHPGSNSKTAQLRRLFPEMAAARAAGVTPKQIAATLRRIGLAITDDSFAVLYRRIQKERLGEPPRPPGPDTPNRFLHHLNLAATEPVMTKPIIIVGPTGDVKHYIALALQQQLWPLAGNDYPVVVRLHDRHPERFIGYLLLASTGLPAIAVYDGSERMLSKLIAAAGDRAPKDLIIETSIETNAGRSSIAATARRLATLARQPAPPPRTTNVPAAEPF